MQSEKETQNPAAGQNAAVKTAETLSPSNSAAIKAKLDSGALKIEGKSKSAVKKENPSKPAAVAAVPVTPAVPETFSEIKGVALNRWGDIAIGKGKDRAFKLQRGFYLCSAEEGKIAFERTNDVVTNLESAKSTEFPVRELKENQYLIKLFPNSGNFYHHRAASKKLAEVAKIQVGDKLNFRIEAGNKGFFIKA